MTDHQTAIDIAARSSARAENASRNHATELMVQHLRDEHAYGPYAIARRLKLKVSYVKQVLGRANGTS